MEKSLTYHVQPRIAACKSVTATLKAQASCFPDDIVLNGINNYLVDRLKDRNSLNAFIRVLRACMRDKLNDGID